MTLQPALHPQSICATCGHKAMRHQDGGTPGTGIIKYSGPCLKWIETTLTVPGHFCGCEVFQGKE
jgi:hypothetical protein